MAFKVKLCCDNLKVTIDTSYAYESEGNITYFHTFLSEENDFLNINDITDTFNVEYVDDKYFYIYHLHNNIKYYLQNQGNIDLTAFILGNKQLFEIIDDCLFYKIEEDRPKFCLRIINENGCCYLSDISSDTFPDNKRFVKIVKI